METGSGGPAGLRGGSQRGLTLSPFPSEAENILNETLGAA